MNGENHELPLISVIFPAYNVEKFVEKAVASVMNQDYPHFEILFIDDRSTDNTASVAQRTLDSCTRPVRLIRRTENRGVSAARNLGLALSRGEFVCFIDADDFIEPNYLTLLYNAISAEKSDLALCGFNHYFADSGKTVPERFKLKKSLAQPEDYLFAWHMRKISTSVWGFLYRREFLLSKGIRFNERCNRGEDGEFIQKILVRSSKTVFVRERPYNYVHHDQQITAIGREDERAPGLKKEMILASVRAARYVLRYSRSKKVRYAVRYIQEPEILIGRFTFYARRRDWENYRSRLRFLRHRMVRKILLSSFWALPYSPELFFKCVVLLSAPRLFYKLRARQLRSPRP